MGVRFDSEHGLQIAEPTVDPSLGIPLPSHRFPSLHCMTKPVVGNPQFSFRLPAFRSLPRQPENQQHFHYDQSNTANDVALVSLPTRRFPVEDNAAWRKIALLESPALQGSPIEHVSAYAFYSRNVLRLFAIKNPQRHSPGNFALIADAGNVASHLPVIQIDVKNTKNRRVRSCRNQGAC